MSPSSSPLSNADSAREFKAALIELAEIPPGPAADAAALRVLERFILGRPAAEPSKASRFALFCQMPRLNPNLAIPLFDPSPLSGIAPASERPAEFAISQFLASGCAPAWRDCVERLAGSERMGAAFNRPLLFFKLGLSQSSEIEDDDEDPQFELIFFPAFANAYLRFEARRMSEPAAGACRDLASLIEARMSPSARAAAASDHFTLSSLGAMAHVVERSLAGAARAPIAAPPRSEVLDPQEGPAEDIPALLRRLGAPKRR